MEKPEDDLPPFCIEAAQAVVLMHPFPSEAETGKAIEAVRCAILSAVEEERAACAEVAGQQWKSTSAGWNDVAESASKITSGETAAAIRNRKGA